MVLSNRRCQELKLGFNGLLPFFNFIQLLSHELIMLVHGFGMVRAHIKYGLEKGRDHKK